MGTSVRMMKVNNVDWQWTYLLHKDSTSFNFLCEFILIFYMLVGNR